MRVEQYLFLFLKFISCVIPTVEYSADTDAPGASVPYGRATRTSLTCCVRNRRRRAACPQGPTYSTYWVRVPASAVRCRPCPVVITPGGVRPHHLRRWALISTRSRSDLACSGRPLRSTQWPFSHPSISPFPPSPVFHGGRPRDPWMAPTYTLIEELPLPPWERGCWFCGLCGEWSESPIASHVSHESRAVPG